MLTKIEREGGAPVRIPEGKLLIDGEWHQSISEEFIDVFDPASEERIATIAAASPADVDLAVHAARRTFESKTWQKMRPLDRGRLLEKLALLIERDAEELARLETLDSGKPTTSPAMST